MKIGERLIKIRIEKNKKAAEIADLLNIDVNSYYRYEQDNRTIDIYDLIKLAKFYGESLDYICGLED